jgi:phosphopantetheinyl transferase
MLRNWASKTFDVASNRLHFTRTERGRPRLLDLNQGEEWDFNVSHAGNYTVFVAQSNSGLKITFITHPDFSIHSIKG